MPNNASPAARKHELAPATVSQHLDKTETSPAGASLKTWIAILALAIGCFTFVSSEMLPIGLLGPIAAGIHLSLGMTGLLVTGFALFVAITAGPLTVLTARFDRKWIMVGLMVVCLVGNALAAVATTFTLLLLARIIVAMAIGVFWSIATAMAIRLVPQHQAVRATSLVLGGLAVAAVLGVPLGTLIGQYFGWHAAFGALSLLSLVVCVAALIVLPPLPSQSTGNLRAIIDAFYHGQIRFIFFTTALVMTGNFLAYTYITPYLQDVSGIPASWISSLLLLYGAAGVLGNFSIGSAMARSLRGALILTLTVLALSMIMLWGVAQYKFAVIALLVPWGMSYAALPVLLQTWVFRAAGETGDVEAALSLFVVAFNGAIAIGALAGGLALDVFGAHVVVLLAAVIIALSLLLVLRSSHGRHR
ncbi:MFS transporter [Sodalis sp. RH21]|uniref:MFS transporter n=1 Tax=unclassified Sodalis (in: enterobacteria) TaxID=2636512 RepID=UPI0039B5F911